jgi:RNA polymerase sigma factor for flagellar operon FliA
VLVPAEPERPDTAYERAEVRDRVRGAIEALPWRERKVIGLYYYGEVTMKQIGQEIGVNESRVSQLHARAIRRLRDALGNTMAPAEAAAMLRSTVLQFMQKPAALKANVPAEAAATHQAGVVLPYTRTSRAARSKSPSLNGFASQRQPLSSRKRSASVPATSPVTKMTRVASSVAAIAR